MVSTGETTDKIMERVRLLLARAESTHSENEANLCRERAERLIIKHGITSLEEKSEIMRLTVNLTGYSRAALPKMQLLLGIGSVFGCKVVQTGKQVCYLAGRETALDLSWELFQLLEEQLDEKLSDPSRTSSVGQYAYGWVLRVNERIEEMYRQEVQETASTGHDLVLANNMDKVDGYLSENGVSAGKSRKRRVSVSSEGQDHGDLADIGINSRKVNASSTQAIDA